jgi:hypothetical protein
MRGLDVCYWAPAADWDFGAAAGDCWMNCRNKSPNGPSVLVRIDFTAGAIF